jgi:hypothetical protein
MALKILHTLIFDFLNYASGRLDPSYAAIARKANVCQRTVASSIAKLRDCGVLTWIRRCSHETQKDGRSTLRQNTNAYAVLPETQWRGYLPPAEPPAPMPGTWGDHPGLPSVMAQAAADRQAGATMGQVIRTLASDPADALGAALARLGQAMQAAKSEALPGLQAMH